VSGATGPFLTVIGVVRDALIFGIGERPRPVVYQSQLQNPTERDVTLLVRSAGDATTLSAAMRREMRELDRDVPLYALQSLGQYRHDRLSDLSIGSALLGIIGSLAVALASLGLYAVVAFSIGQRTREIGIRVALGAAQRQVVSLFVREGVRLAMVGVVVGIVLAAGVVKLLSAVFLGVASSDALTFALIATMLGAIATLASWIPARRAARVDPMSALRSD
jgi:ABC-type antimicrobial peptide transport system permease subunit